MEKNLSERPMIVKFFAHMHTINAHHRAVRKNCFKCGLYWQGLTHDLSKYSPSELWESVRYYQGDRSPYIYEKELFGYAPGWLHHKGHNKHHWEYWSDLINGKWTPIEMPFNYFVEMVCDRVGACHIYQKDQYTNASPLNYFLASKGDRQYMHPKTEQALRETLSDISERGEDAVFADLKVRVKEWKKEKRNAH